MSQFSVPTRTVLCKVENKSERLSATKTDYANGHKNVHLVADFLLYGNEDISVKISKIS